MSLNKSAESPCWRRTSVDIPDLWNLLSSQEARVRSVPKELSERGLPDNILRGPHLRHRFSPVAGLRHTLLCISGVGELVSVRQMQGPHRRLSRVAGH
jgi:hypothetical protein